jgi:5-formyltetrahydrofolate cyclo-ligase
MLRQGTYQGRPYRGSVTDVRSAKQALRERMLTRRRAMSARTLAESAGALRDVLLGDDEVAAARTVACYVSVGGEPGTGPLLDELERRGTETLLPVLRPDDDLDWARYTGAEGLAPASRGLLEPRARPLGVSAVGRATVVMVPALAVDRRGRRLGRGGGSYDRTLAHLVGTPALVVALLHHGELLDLPIPTEPHDRPVHAVATPSGIVRLR